MFIALGLFNFFIYYFLSQKLDVTLKIIFGVLFFFISFIFMVNVDVSKMPDYQAYFAVIGTSEPELSIKTLFAEPYYFQLVNLFAKSHSTEFSIKIFYYINFILTSSFFIWLACMKDISVWKKMLLYALYYYFFSYVLLRNTPAYILVGLLFYTLQKNEFLKISVLSFMAHLTALPIIAFSVFKNKKADIYLFLFVLLYMYFFKFIINLNLLDLYSRLSVYQENQDGPSIFHKLYFGLFIGINIFLFFKNKALILNYTYIFLFATYLIFQFINPVMGYRFSIYLVMYILLSPNFNFEIKTEKVLNYCSLLVLGCFLIFNIKYLFT